MADPTDVQAALAAEIAQTLYPNGTSQPSITGGAFKIYPGWPVAAALESDLSNGVSHVSVFGLAMSKAVHQMPGIWQTVSITPSQLVATITGMTIALAGTITTPQAVTVTQGKTIASYAVQATDTLTSICTALAALIPGATSSGATLTLPTGADPTVGYAMPAAMIAEVGRQQQVFQVSVWANTPALRAQIAKSIDPAIRAAYRLTMPDTTSASIRYVGSADDDNLQIRNAYVRHLRYESEFLTALTQTATTVTAPVVDVSVSLNAL